MAVLRFAQADFPSFPTCCPATGRSTLRSISNLLPAHRVNDRAKLIRGAPDREAAIKALLPLPDPCSESPPISRTFTGKHWIKSKSPTLSEMMSCFMQ
jgi:hypothetical protein